MELIHGTTLVHLGVNLWSGKKKADRDKDVVVGSGGKMPPQKLLEIGRKTIYPTEALRPMVNRKKAAERVCLRVGTRFMGGYMIPDDMVDGVKERLAEIEVSFQEDLKEFLLNYDVKRDEWLNNEENEEYSYIFEDQIPPVDQVEKAYGFNFTFYKFSPLEGFEPDQDEIANQVLHEIGVSCREVVKRLLERKQAVSGIKLIEMLDPMVEKLNRLAFGHGSVLTVLQEFETLQASIPHERIDQDHPSYSNVVTFLSMCDDEEKLSDIAKGNYSVVALLKPKSAPTQESVLPAQMSNTSTTNSPVKAASLDAGVRVGGFF